MDQEHGNGCEGGLPEAGHPALCERAASGFFRVEELQCELRNAYDDNLANYKNDIPQLFTPNAICVLSNCIETRVGSLTAQWEHYFHWLRPDDEKEKIKRDEIREQGTSERFIEGICPKAKHNYVENFVIYHKETQKIIAQNHQFIGVNKGFDKFLRRDEFGGRLGVLAHAGFGEELFDDLLCAEDFRKCQGNYSFLVVTDREDLDGQTHRNFTLAHRHGEKRSDTAQPKDSKQLRKFLGENKRLVFTLIQKFRYDKGKAYPVLSERDDIIVIVDEAHRTQYKSLAEICGRACPKPSIWPSPARHYSGGTVRQTNGLVTMFPNIISASPWMTGPLCPCSTRSGCLRCTFRTMT